jgi:pimeloyl-ACP methyl ester carboxylesterase
MRFDVNGTGCYAYTGSRPMDASSPAIVFVHGAANDHSVWAQQSRYFAHHGFNVLAVDLPAHGRSGGAALASVEAMAHWITQVLDAAGVARAAIVGHSLGSLATLACAARHPARVSRIALLGTAAPMLVSDELMAAALSNDHVALELINGWSISAGKQLGGNAVPGMWMTRNSMRLMERTRPGVLHADLEACRAYSNGLIDGASVTCPVLVIMGARDVMTPTRDVEPLLAALADRRTLLLPDTGHAMMAEQPDAVLDALRAFL